MKWLILILLFSCGKHQEPEALDLRDSDGDQVQNYSESEFDKHVANFEQLGVVSGLLKFNNQEVEFTNEKNLHEQTLDLLVLNENLKQRDDYFHESSLINLTKKIDLENTGKLQFKVELSFNSMKILPDEIYLYDEKSETRLGAWFPQIPLSLSASELSRILSGKSKLVVRKKLKASGLWANEVDDSIRDKTYRVHYYDGGQSKVMYVSRALPFNEFLRLMKINVAHEVEQDSLFFNHNKDFSNKWYYRSFADGDMVLAYTSETILADEFLDNFDFTKKTISRLNGVPASGFKANIKQGARVFMRIKSPRGIMRHFAERSRVTEYREHMSTPYSCTHFIRDIKEERSVSPGLQNLLHQIVFLTNGVVTQVSGFDAEKPQDGDYWEAKIENSSEQLELSLPPLDEKTFTMVGEYKNSCGGSRATKMNAEAQLSFEIETYVEKIE